MEAQRRFALELLSACGYDPEAGRLDPTAHPFEIAIGPGDVRITTRYYEDFFNAGIFGTLHEMGHALYEQGLPKEHWGTPRGDAVSLGVHESQSRTWENLVGRSLGFWERFFPRAREVFASLGDVSLEDFHFAVNAVEPSLIRVEADEVTYNLHILVRLELELALFRGELSPEDLPEAWAEKYRDHLGVAPKDYKDGVMQDVHWAGGFSATSPPTPWATSTPPSSSRRRRPSSAPWSLGLPGESSSPSWTGRARGSTPREAASAPGSWWNGSRGRPRAPGPSWPTWRKSTPPSTADAVPGT